MERRKLVQWRDLLLNLVTRDLKMRYKRSVLGNLWSLLNPLFLLIVYVFLFQQVLKVNIQNYPLFMFCAILPWNWFSSTLSMAPRAVIDNRDLVRKPYFPTQVLPIVTTLASLVNYLFALPVLFVFLLIFRVHLGVALLALPLMLGIQFLLSTGIAFIIATANVRFRDIQHLIGIVMIFWFYLTPIFYDSAAVPEKFKAAYWLNPMAHLIDAYRDIFLYARLPDPILLLTLLTISLIVFVGGYNMFVSQKYSFVEEL
jgi:lipopolysaccharide transport system permease protein